MHKSKKQAVVFPDHDNGIYLYEYPVIHGIKQYVQVRGTDRSNPLLLFLHGGPGASVAGLCHILQAGWEEHFTVVNWDQRNTCKTYFANKDRAAEIAQTGTMEDFIRDIDEIIAWLHTVYEFEKLVLVGFSWGSAIGSEYAKRHPEHLLCYIGVGQLFHYRDNVLFTCQKLLDVIPKESKDAEKVKRMMETLPETPAWDKALMNCMRYYAPLCYRYIAKHAKSVSSRELFRSPFMNLKEKLHCSIPKYALHTKAYETMLAYDFRNAMNYDVPVLFVFGEEETVCNYELIAECLADIAAPKKQLEIIPNASHNCYFDQPEQFMQKVLSFMNDINQGG